jgi:hypothetical protein
MSTTPSPVPGLPPGQPREQLLKALAARFPTATDKFDPPKPWSEKRDREDEDDDDSRIVSAWFRHRMADGTDISTELVEMTTSEWEEWSESKDPGWAVSRDRDIVRAVKITTFDGTAKGMPPPEAAQVDRSTVERVLNDDTIEHAAHWMSRRKGEQAKVTWFVTSPREWSRDKRSADHNWVATKLSARKIMVMSVVF